GLYARYLPFDIDLEDSAVFSALARTVDKTANEARMLQHYFDYGYIFASDRDRNEKDYFPYLFEYEAERASSSAEGVNYRIEKQYACIDRFDLKLECYRSGDDLTVEFHYDLALYAPQDVAELIDHYLTILQSAIEDPHRSIGSLEMLSARQRKMI